MKDDRLEQADRWSVERAWAWRREIGWLCGFNYLPSVAVNFVEFWRGADFAPEVIERELGWAREIGFNVVRVNLPFVVWQAEGTGLLDRVDRFLAIAASHGLGVILCPFDDCEFSGEPATPGPQPDPVPAVHNSRAVGSPGRAIVEDPSRRPELETYLRAIVMRFRADSRVILWDLYNEPGNRMIFRSGRYESYPERLEEASLSLMRDCFAWARECGASQPLTVAAWSVPGEGTSYATEIDRSALALSDVATFHAYVPRARMEATITALSALKRPLICTEWMARSLDSTIAEQIPLFRETGVGALQWGFVRGRSQTWLPWPDGVSGTAKIGEDGAWFHDLVDQTGQPYSPAEILEINAATRSG